MAFHGHPSEPDAADPALLGAQSSIRNHAPENTPVTMGTSDTLSWKQELRSTLEEVNWRSARKFLSHRRSQILEIVLIILWAVWAGREYLDLSEFLWPAGTDPGSKLLGHHFWTNLVECGPCALWNGAINGGRPALADRFGGQFHPLVAMATLLWGVVGGVKITIVASMALAGIAQWWIASSLALGRAARIWSAFAAVVGGHLATKHYEGNFIILLSTVACTLVLAAIISLSRRQRRRDIALLSLLGGMAIVSGQGYMQLTLLAWAPAILFFYLDEAIDMQSLIKQLAFSVAIGILLAGIVIIPTLHFWPNFTKDLVDPQFPLSQPLEYIPLNLLIRDRVFFNLPDVLGKQPYSDLLYIGWVPVLLALLSIRFARKKDGASLLFLGSGALISFFMASGIPLRWLAKWSDFFLGFRFTSLMSGLAVPAILGLAAFGLDRLLKADWPSLQLSLDQSDLGSGDITIDLRWLLAIPLLLSLRSGYQFTDEFIYTQDRTEVYEEVGILETRNTQWVATPFGQMNWVEPAIQKDLKLTNVNFSGKLWKGRDLPEPYLIADPNPPAPDAEVIGTMAGMQVFRLPQNEYAHVQVSPSSNTPCEARGQAGRIEVSCHNEQDGQLIVKEYSWDGWTAWMDGDPVDLHDSDWLAVSAPAGAHKYTFLYRPWDVLLGLSCTLVGMFLVALLVIRPEENQSPQHRSNRHGEEQG